MLRGPPLPRLKHATIGEALAAAAEASTATSTSSHTATSAATPTSTPTEPIGLTFLDAREQAQHFSFSDLRLRARRAAAGLAAIGVRRGDRVAVGIASRRGRGLGPIGLTVGLCQRADRVAARLTDQ